VLPGTRPSRRAARQPNLDYADAHYNLGVALAESAGRTREAIAHLETAQHLRPGAELARTIQRLKGRGVERPFTLP